MARKQYPLRIDPAVWDAVSRWADDDFRSVNAQVEWIIRDALKRAGRLPHGRTDDAPPAHRESPAGDEPPAHRETPAGDEPQPLDASN